MVVAFLSLTLASTLSKLSSDFFKQGTRHGWRSSGSQRCRAFMSGLQLEAKPRRSAVVQGSVSFRSRGRIPRGTFSVTTRI